MILVNWYGNSTAIVNWEGVFSPSYRLLAGVRTRRSLFILALFAVYIDGLIQTIQNQGLGCHTGLLSIAIFMYADDLVILSSSVTDLHTFESTLVSMNFVALDLSINASKSINVFA